MTPASVPQKTISFAVRRLVILLPADNLPTFCCVLLNQILFFTNVCRSYFNIEYLNGDDKKCRQVQANNSAHLSSYHRDH